MIISKSILQGVVARTARGRIWVVPTTDCIDKKGCKGGCGSCSGKTSYKKVMVITPIANRYARGMYATVEYFAPNEFVGALVVFGIPLFAVFLLLLVWYIISPTTIESGPAMLATGGSFISGFFIVQLVDWWFRRHYPSSILSQPPSLSSETVGQAGRDG